MLGGTGKKGKDYGKKDGKTPGKLSKRIAASKLCKIPTLSNVALCINLNEKNCNYKC